MSSSISRLRSWLRRWRKASRPARELETWLLNLPLAKDFKQVRTGIAARQDLKLITVSDEITCLFLLIRRLQPEMVLEIGTFFAGTSRIMTEALAENERAGKLVTIDPFGGHRVPEIIQSWPERLRSLVEFLPLNSMDYFVDLSIKGVPKGLGSPFGVIFVDGNHNLEYALFDLVRSADHLRPGGVIVVDNMEQHGPRDAVLQFLRWNPAWTLCSEFRMLDANVSDAEFAALYNSDNLLQWGVLISPEGTQISGITRKFHGRLDAYRPILGVRLNVKEMSRPGRVDIYLNYYATPYDYHLTGEGLVQKVVRFSLKCPDFQPVMMAWLDDPAELALGPCEVNVQYELEVVFIPTGGRLGHILLDAEIPYQFV